MNSNVFFDYLIDLGYTCHKYPSCGDMYVCWAYNELGFTSQISYVINSKGILRQQFIDTENIVRLFIQIHPHNNAGDWNDYSFKDCLENIVYKKLGTKNGLIKTQKFLRKRKLNKIKKT